MKGIYKVLGFVGVSLGLVALLLAGMVPAGGQDSPFKEIERNLRHPQGEIIELEGSLSFAECERFQEHIQKYKDAFWFVDEPQVLVGTFVQELSTGSIPILHLCSGSLTSSLRSTTAEEKKLESRRRGAHPDSWPTWVGRK